METDTDEIVAIFLGNIVQLSKTETMTSGWYDMLKLREAPWRINDCHHVIVPMDILFRVSNREMSSHESYNNYRDPTFPSSQNNHWTRTLQYVIHLFLTRQPRVRFKIIFL